MLDAVVRILLSRAVLVLLPFVVFFVWREVARRTGRPMGATPWTWLAAAGAALVGLSLIATVIFHPDNRGQAYVPAQAHPGGAVTPSGFDPSRAPRPPAETAPNTAP